MLSMHEHAVRQGIHDRPIIENAAVLRAFPVRRRPSPRRLERHGTVGATVATVAAAALTTFAIVGPNVLNEDDIARRRLPPTPQESPPPSWVTTSGECRRQVFRSRAGALGRRADTTGHPGADHLTPSVPARRPGRLRGLHGKVPRGHSRSTNPAGVATSSVLPTQRGAA